MAALDELIAGYRAFRRERYAEEAARYRALAAGQRPKVMAIGCCDSRVDPATIFSAGPGELFVVRNVANLVPPAEPHGDYHGTSAAIEFAVTGLQVEAIVVMGHASCGGVTAFLDGLYDPPAGGYIARWVSLMKAAHPDAVNHAAGRAPEAMQQAMEEANVRQSLRNLRTFDFVDERVGDGRLTLHGAYFGVASGVLSLLNPETDTFEPVTVEDDAT